MEKFTPFESRMVVIARDNIDTDQIIPARFLKTISKDGLGDQLFFDWRYDAEGSPKPGFIINTPQGKAAQVLLTGDNFGCGSSREHAPWALTQYGFRAVIRRLEYDTDCAVRENVRNAVFVGVVHPFFNNSVLNLTIQAGRIRVVTRSPGRCCWGEIFVQSS